MSGDYSISLNGIFAAQRAFAQSAQRVAADVLPDPADMVAIQQAKIAAKANVKAISVQQELDRETLDLFA